VLLWLRRAGGDVAGGVASGRLEPTLGHESPSECLRVRHLRSTPEDPLGSGSVRSGVCAPVAHHDVLQPSTANLQKVEQASSA
jgi:hypothetical protein